jgi:uncharacterized membrane protein YkoI
MLRFPNEKSHFPCLVDARSRGLLVYSVREEDESRGSTEIKEMNMNKYVYIAAFALCGSALAQDQNLNQPQPARPAQPAPEVSRQPQPTAPATATERAKEGLSNLVNDWRLEDLPQAVQKTVREQAGGQKIADIDRESRTGRTVWEVEFEKAGRNTEIHVSEDGTLMPEENRLFGRTDDQTGRTPGERPAATGTPAGTQTGRSGVAMATGTQWEDLPKAVQQKAAQYGGKEKVADIDREDLRGKVAYEVEFRRQGRNLEIHFGEDGSILESNDPTAAPAQGAAPSAEAGRSPSTEQPIQPQPLPPPAQPAQPLPQAPDQQPPPSNQPRP